MSYVRDIMSRLPKIRFMRQKMMDKILTTSSSSQIENGVASYSQSGEDLVCQFIFNALGIKEGTYLDIGSSHPTELNNTYFFYKKGWRGFNVDPIKFNIEQFKHKRSRDENICAGIGDLSGEREFYEIAPSTLSTFNKAAAEQYVSLGHEITKISNVNFLSCSDLFLNYRIPLDLDLLSLDIEGGEFEVLKSLWKLGARPKVLIVETVSYGHKISEATKQSGLIKEIENQGYLHYADTFINSIFIDYKIPNL